MRTDRLRQPMMSHRAKAWVRFVLVLFGTAFGGAVSAGLTWSDLAELQTLAGLGVALTAAATGALGRSPGDARRLD